MIQDAIYNEEVRRREAAEARADEWKQRHAEERSRSFLRWMHQRNARHKVLRVLAEWRRAEALVEQHEQTIARQAEALDAEHSYWTMRYGMARTETVMAEWHLDLIDAALAVPEGDEK